MHCKNEVPGFAPALALIPGQPFVAVAGPGVSSFPLSLSLSPKISAQVFLLIFAFYRFHRDDVNALGFDARFALLVFLHGRDAALQSPADCVSSKVHWEGRARDGGMLLLDIDVTSPKQRRTVRFCALTSIEAIRKNLNRTFGRGGVPDLNVFTLNALRQSLEESIPGRTIHLSRVRPRQRQNSTRLCGIYCVVSSYYY